MQVGQPPGGMTMQDVVITGAALEEVDRVLAALEALA
jgi:hypothetical protein